MTNAWMESWDAVRRLAPTNARAYVKGITGDTTPIDESYFKPEELTALRMAAMRGMDEFTSHPAPGYTQEHVSYRHYTEPQGVNAFNVDAKMLTDPSVVAMTTIGAAQIERQPGGDVHLVDRYNFNSIATGWSPTPWYRLLRAIGGVLLPEGKGFDVRLNLGNPAHWTESGELVPPLPAPPTPDTTGAFQRTGGSILSPSAPSWGSAGISLGVSP